MFLHVYFQVDVLQTWHLSDKIMQNIIIIDIKVWVHWKKN